MNIAIMCATCVSLKMGELGESELFKTTTQIPHFVHHAVSRKLECLVSECHHFFRQTATAKKMDEHAENEPSNSAVESTSLRFCCCIHPKGILVCQVILIFCSVISAVIGYNNVRDIILAWALLLVALITVIATVKMRRRLLIVSVITLVIVALAVFGISIYNLCNLADYLEHSWYKLLLFNEDVVEIIFVSIMSINALGILVSSLLSACHCWLLMHRSSGESKQNLSVNT